MYPSSRFDLSSSTGGSFTPSCSKPARRLAATSASIWSSARAAARSARLALDWPRGGMPGMEEACLRSKRSSSSSASSFPWPTHPGHLKEAGGPPACEALRLGLRPRNPASFNKPGLSLKTLTSLNQSSTSARSGTHSKFMKRTAVKVSGTSAKNLRASSCRSPSGQKRTSSASTCRSQSTPSRWASSKAHSTATDWRAWTSLTSESNLTVSSYISPFRW
mmetsp:Transcript_93524/g.273854  ORF Transcript_93524/g.273854 Transcript_93524/m.273854 type:complete len:220 (+) Transcript_93524:607-1266(+)